MSFLQLVASPSASSSGASSDSESSGSSADSTSSNSSSSSTAGEETETLETEVKKLRRKAQTQKAREALMRKRLVAKFDKSSGNDIAPADPHPAAQYQPDVFVDSTTLLGSVGPSGRRQRLRLLWSWVTAFTSSIATLVSEREKDICHLLNVCVIDDTNICFGGAREGHDSKGSSSSVVSVMNNIQTLIVRMSGKSDCENPGPGNMQMFYRTFIVQTPLSPLDSTTASGISTEFLAWIMFWLNKVGQRWGRFCCNLRPPACVPIQALAVVWDSLRTNQAVMKGLRQSVHKDGSSSSKAFPLIAFRCALHQLSLIRKHLIFWFPGYWSTIVRLGHLFEIRSFRSSVRRAILKLVISSFQHIPVHQLPAEFDTWHRERTSALQLSQMQTSRIEAHHELQLIDNSDSSSTKIIHWCTGKTCPCGGSPKSALTKVAKWYVFLFGKGFPVPLTYRWKHTDGAMQYCRDAGFHFFV